METLAVTLFDAIKKGDRQAVENLLSQDAGLAAVRDDSGQSAVLTAAYYGQPEIARLLVDRGAPLDLFEACAVGAADRVSAILDADPDQINAWAPDGFQPLGLACFFGHAPIVMLLLEHGADVNTPSRNGLRVQPLNSAVAGQHVEIARMLLDYGANPNARQGEDFTPLHGAAQNGQVEMVRLLLDHGADTHMASAGGKTPLDYAQAGGYPEVVRLLSR